MAVRMHKNKSNQSSRQRPGGSGDNDPVASLPTSVNRDTAKISQKAGKTLGTISSVLEGK